MKFTDKPAPGADGFNYSESRQSSLGPGPGRRPVRKRGYHRALKRGEVWANMEHAMKEMAKTLNKVMFQEVKDHAMSENPLFALLHEIDQG